MVWGMVRALLSRLPLTSLILLLAVVSFTGCNLLKGDCRKLSEKLCECSRNSLEKDACLRRASSEESRIGTTLNRPNAEDEAVCKGLLETCDCNLIDTPEGKERCGLSLAPSGS